MEMKSINNAFIQNNQTFAEGGGLTSYILPYRMGPASIGLTFSSMYAVKLGQDLWAEHNKLKAGPIRYTGGPARMTSNFDSGIVEAIRDVSDDPAVQQDMLKRTMKSSGIGHLDTYGVDGDFVAAFYGM